MKNNIKKYYLDESEKQNKISQTYCNFSGIVIKYQTKRNGDDFKWTN